MRKRFLIPLLAALALPTAVNAEIIRLECGGDKIMGKKEFSINEQTGKVTIQTDKKIINSNKLFASSDSFIFEYYDSLFNTEFQISRNDGSYSLKNWLAISSFDRAMADAKGQDVAFIEKQRKAETKTLFGKNPCSKIEAKKTMF